MAIKPILFNTEMVRAILDGRKTCTRRLVKFLPGENSQWTGYIKDGLMLYNGRNEPCIRKVPYQPGDIMYVRETWQYLYELDGNEQIIEGTGKYYYAATDTIPFDTYVDASGVTHERVPWHPSIHMPKEAARIWLKVTGVRMERLQEMKPVDVIKEGAYPDCWDCLNTYGESGLQCCYGTEEQCSQCDEVMMEWEKLWTSTIKKSDIDRYGWDASPWVWVIKFERCEKPKEV
ncbi:MULTISPECIES: hypothetical protein [unclassified Roseburia]|uniref:hypothetical protein n=1 Tax=unclassified Roseburia TaxID=2637578 RepID=UPI0018F39454|nr:MULTISPECIES: hypothetical protein [unclassified Roseburia]